MRRLPLALAPLAAVVLFLAFFAISASAQEGWEVRRFDVSMVVNADGTIDVVEDIEVDFGSLQRHGILRDLRQRMRCGDVPAGPEPLHPCPSGSDRLWRYEDIAVTDFEGRPHPWTSFSEGDMLRVRIGDADVFVTGAQQYRISYRITGALNAFDDHDELFWNITGEWDAPISVFSAIVELPPGAGADGLCLQGYYESTAQCEADVRDDRVFYGSTRALFPYEQVTIAASWQRGLVDVPPPLLEDRLSIDDFFTFDTFEWAGAALVGLLGLVALGRAWWLFGRDRKYQTVYYLTDDPAEHTRPLFQGRELVVEYTPPDGIRPAQAGVLIDERADTLDVTATIIDLAVRGYLRIHEIPKKWLFGSTDWELEKLDAPVDDLLPYERELYDALFAGSKERVKVSALKNKFAEKLGKVKKELYKDAVGRGWFEQSPEMARTTWLIAGFALAGLGVPAAVGAGWFLERALIGAPLIVAGVVLMLVSRAMPRRTAAGSEAERRVLGFRLYVDTAESRRMEFAEQKNIFAPVFARYLPYAIVFDCVDKWAKAFEGLEDEISQAAAGWYVGMAPFHLRSFSEGMSGFSSSVGSVIASTPGGSGGSGFSGGGFSGGGGGGGGGSSW